MKRKKQNPMVTLWEPRTGTFTEIPRAELAPGMVQRKIPGRPGLVWAAASDVAPKGVFLHPPFEGPRKDAVVAIHQAFSEILDWDYKFYEDGFRQDQAPDREILIWLSIAKIYEERSVGRPMAEKREIYALLAACSTVEKDSLKEVFSREHLYPAEYEAISSEYYTAIYG